MNMGPAENPVPQKVLPPISRPRQKRIREIQNLFDSGWKVAEIMAHFGISERTVYYDLEKGKELDRALAEGVDQAATLGREIRFLEESRRKELRAYHLAKNPQVKIGHMRNAITIHEKLMKLLQDAGLVIKMPERLSIEEGNPFSDLEFRAKYIALMKEARAKGIIIHGL